MRSITSLLAASAACIVTIAHATIPAESRNLQLITFPAESNYSTSLLNPERGHYAHTESLASAPSALTTSYLEGVRGSGRSVVLRVYYLDSFLETDVINQTFVDHVAADFQTMLASGVKCVIRFAYYKPTAWPDPNPPDKTEPDLARIRLHIAALTPVLQAWTHAIVAVQNGIIGPWGEGHGSTHFSCDASNGGKRQIINDLLAAVPGRMVQVRYPSLKPQLWYPDEEASMSIVAGASNLVENSDMETIDNGAGAPASFFVWVGTGSPSIETTDESISGRGAKVYAGFGAAQTISFDSIQGASGNIIKIFGNSKLFGGVMPDTDVESDYSIYTDITFTDESSLFGKAASFCGSGEWEYAAEYVTVPTGKTVESMNFYLMYRNVAANTTGYAIFDDVGVTVFNPHSVDMNNVNALDGTNQTRTGHHNDCFLASDTDLGTYTDGNIDAEKNYIEVESKFTVMGGETCAVNAPRSECTTALAELKRFHYSYLNEDYNADVISSWTTGDSTGSCKDEISSRLGYRLVITSADISPTNFIPGGDVSYSINIKNTGYARPTNEYRVRLKFVSTDEECTMDHSDVDIRTWYANDTDVYAISGVARLPTNIPDGSYAVYMVIADAHGDLTSNPLFNIGVANENLFDSTTGMNDLLHSITIDSTNATLVVGEDSNPNTVSCGSGISDSPTSPPSLPPTSSPSPPPPPPQPCHPAYVVGGPYSPGDKVSKSITVYPATNETTYNYECVPGKPSFYCNAAMFIPFAWLRKLDPCAVEATVEEATFEANNNNTNATVEATQ